MIKSTFFCCFMCIAIQQTTQLFWNSSGTPHNQKNIRIDLYLRYRIEILKRQDGQQTGTTKYGTGTLWIVDDTGANWN